jgi:hypothetical protein
MKQPKAKPPQKSIEQYRKALQSGADEGYRAVLGFLADWRLQLQKKHPDYAVSALQVGQMDFSYFTFTTAALKKRSLKVVVLFVHNRFSFEVWLSGQNKAVATKALRLLQDVGWSKHELAMDTRSVDYAAKTCLLVDANFSSPQTLSAQLEQGIVGFVDDVEAALAKAL